MYAPWLVEVTRGSIVECRHIIHGIAITANGTAVEEFGDVDRKIYPRSAAKWLQALELILSGTAKKQRLTDEHLALACSSHNGEAEHVQKVSKWLNYLNFTSEDLECGIANPLSEEVHLQLACADMSLTPFHHCCSGKHSGMLSICHHLKLPTKGYTDYGHPIQQRIRERLSEVLEIDVNLLPHAADGCSVPTYATPLRALALGFAKLGAGRFGLNTNQAGQRLFEAQTNHPFLIAGSNRLDSALIEAGQGRLQIKMGADGVYCGALPDRELGFALKCDDGSRRGQEMAVVELLKSIGEIETVNRLPKCYRFPTIKTAQNVVVGSVSVNRG